MLWWIQKEEYVKSVGYIPEEFPEGTEGHTQFSYNPRTKKSREYFETYTQKLPLRPQQAKKSLSKAPRKNRRVAREGAK